MRTNFFTADNARDAAMEARLQREIEAENATAESSLTQAINDAITQIRSHADSGRLEAELALTTTLNSEDEVIALVDALQKRFFKVSDVSSRLRGEGFAYTIVELHVSW